MTDINHMLRVNPKNSHRGAPMGRGFGSPQVGERCHLQQVDLDSGGYDASGAYWGGRAVGQRLYCAFSTLNAPSEWQQYVDARDRVEALTKVTDVYGVIPFKWSP
jgi:hypothetical protein